MALSEKAKPKAILSLKRAKRLEEIVEKRSNSLLTIEQIIEKIESAESEEKVDTSKYSLTSCRFYKLILSGQRHFAPLYHAQISARLRILWTN